MHRGRFQSKPRADPRRPQPATDPTPPMCCGDPARLTTGREIYPHRDDLHHRWFFKCDRCEGYVGTHRKTREPLGFPAGPELREERQRVHAILDPLWQNAWTLYRGGEMNRPAIQAAARRRCYEWLAAQLGINRDECHTAMFDFGLCEAAIQAMRGVGYHEIREWDKGRKGQAIKDSRIFRGGTD